ncbi:Ribosome biogenesis protein NSA1 [Leucoagaricus sp. SymC.cos]|nr:Ribosome biogenesis protein NSA1 [Leucoagaricus sp. SymC.cos]
MPRFLFGDEQGQIKSLHWFGEPSEDNSKYKLTALSGRINEEHKISIQRMALNPNIGGSKTVIAGLSNGAVTISTFKSGDEEKLETVKEWKDTRFKQGSSYIGLAAKDDKVYMCSTNGALQVTTVPDLAPESAPTHQRTSLPVRLHDWKLSPDTTTFAYGGDEVELSVWNTETAFHPRREDLNNSAAASKKRKRNNELFPGEIWRAKNVANDALGLRQPTRITSIDYVSSNSSGHQIITGTQFGDVRWYDTRAARRPVSDWKGVGKVGGIQVVKKGLSEHEVFVSDYGTNLLSIDLRNGRTVYGYKGLSGSATSLAPSPSILASTANDRYARIHSSFPPPSKEGQNLDCKGTVLEKIYVTSVPTVVVWDDTSYEIRKRGSSNEEPEDEVWNEMEQVGESDSEVQGKNKRRHLS